MAALNPSDSRRQLADFIAPNGQRVDLTTGEIKSSPYTEAHQKLLEVRPRNSKKTSSSSFVAPRDVSSKTKLSGKDYARLAAAGDPHDPDINARPTGNARHRFYTDYVMKERIRKVNASMKAKGRTDLLPTSGREYKREMNRLILDFKARYPDVPLSEAHLMHVNPKSGTGTNTWGNLKLGPKGLNLEQHVAHPSAFRQLTSEQAARFGAQGSRTAASWEGTPDFEAATPRSEINPNTGMRKPIGPVGAGVKGLGALSMLTGPITAGAELIAAKKNNKPYSVDDFMKALLGLNGMDVPGSSSQGPMG